MTYAKRVETCDLQVFHFNLIGNTYMHMDSCNVPLLVSFTCCCNTLTVVMLGCVCTANVLLVIVLRCILGEIYCFVQRIV